MNRKKTVKRVVLWILMLAVVGTLTALPMLVKKAGSSVQTALVSAQVTKGSITRTLAGGGALQAQDAVELTLPEGVEIKRFLVANGQTVEEGQALAELDPTSVLAAIGEVQDSLDSLGQQIGAAAASRTTQTISAQSEGRVKAVYAAVGDDVRGAVLEYGSLAIVSLDGQMSVKFDSDAALRSGEAVSVRLTDGREYEGRIASVLNGAVTVTLTDDGPQLGDAALVCSADGTLLGSGSLAVHSPWRVMASDGKISGVYVKEGQKVYQNTRLFRTEDAGGTELVRLSEKRRSYEELLQELLVLFQSSQLKAPCAGIVSGVDTSLAAGLAASGEGKITLLAEPPAADFSYVLIMVTKADETGGYIGKSMVWPMSINDESELALLLGLSSAVLDSAQEMPVDIAGAVTLDGAAVTQIQPGDVFVRIMEGETLAKTVYIGHNELGPNTPGVDPSQWISGITINIGGMGGGTGSTTQEGDGLFPLEGRTVLSVTPTESMKVVISVDEQDVLQYRKGMEAEITLDALMGERFTGVVTQIAAVGTNNGGSSKYEVTLELPYAERMLPGMNASVVTYAGQRSEVLTIPAAALSESGTKCMVYTACDPQRQTLSSPVEVEIGVSDGDSVEILSGLEEGQSVWYRSYSAAEQK